MLTGHLDWPLEVPVLPPLTVLLEDSVVEVECLDRFEVTIQEDATKPAVNVYYVRGVFGQPNEIRVEEIAVANAARHGPILT